MDAIHRVEAAEERLEEPEPHGEHEAPCHEDDRHRADIETERHRAAALCPGEGEPRDDHRGDDSEWAERVATEPRQTERRPPKVPVGTAADQGSTDRRSGGGDRTGARRRIDHPRRRRGRVLGDRRVGGRRGRFGRLGAWVGEEIVVIDAERTIRYLKTR